MIYTLMIFTCAMTEPCQWSEHSIHPTEKACSMEGLAWNPSGQFKCFKTKVPLPRPKPLPAAPWEDPRP